MPNTPLNQVNLLTSFPDNTTRLITPQNMRNFVVSTWNTVDIGPGLSGQSLVSFGSGVNPTWSAIAGGGISSGSVSSGYVASGAIQGSLGATKHIASGTIGSFDIGSGAITSGKLGTTGTPNGTLFLRDDFSWAAAGGGLSSGAVGSGYVASGAIQGSLGATKHIASGTIGSFDIGSGAILNSAIGSGQIVTNHIASGGLQSSAIGSGQISNSHLANGAVTSGDIASGQISTFHIASGGLLSGAIGSGQIGHFHISSGAITSGQLGTTGTPNGTLFLRDDFSWAAAGGGLSSGAVGSGYVASGTVQGFFGTTRNIASGTVGSFDFGSGAILSGAIASGQIGHFHIGSGAITSGQLGTTGTPNGTLFLRDDFSWAAAGGGLSSGAVGSGYVASGTVQGFFGTTRNIASGTVGSFDFGSGAVLSGAIASGQVGQFHISSGAITSGKLGTTGTPNGTLFLRDDFSWATAGASLTSGVVGSGYVASGAVQGFFGITRTIASGTVGSFDFGSGAVLSGAIASGQIGQFHIANSAVRSGAIGSGQVSSFHIASGGLLSSAIGNGQINSSKLANDAVTSGAIASGQVSTFHIASGGLLSGAIGSGQIGSNHLADNSVLSGDIASGQVSTFHLASGTAINRSLYSTPIISGTSATTEEIISGIKAVTISQSGNLRIAMAGVSGRMPAIGIVYDNVASGIQTNVYTNGNFQLTSGMADYSGYIGKQLYVGRSGQIVTTSGSFNSGGFWSGDIIQPIGEVVHSGGALINIQAPTTDIITSPKWTPAQATSVTPVLFWDIEVMRKNNNLWQDTGKTTLATADGHIVSKITDPNTNIDYTPVVVMYLRYKNGMWCLSENPQSLVYGRIESIPMTLTPPYCWGVQANFKQTTGNYNTALAGENGQVSFTYWNDDKLTMFNVSVQLTTTNSYLTNNAISAFGAYSVTANKGFVRQQGYDVFRGTTTGNTYSNLHINQGYIGGPSNKADVAKVIVANGNISSAETLLVENWMQDATNAKDRLKPFLQFSFDGITVSPTAEYLRVFQADTYKGPWELIGNSYRPQLPPWSQSNHSVRDTKVFQWAGNSWVAYTWGGLAFGPFPQTQSFGLAKCTSWPLEWYAQTDVDCSDVIPNNANSRCFMADAGIINGIKAYVILNVHGSSADPFQFNCYIKTSTDATLTTWNATTALTGSALPAKASSGKLWQENGIFYFFCKDVSADPAGSHYILKSDGDETGPYNSSRTLTELNDTGGTRTGYEYVEGDELIKLDDGTYLFSLDRYVSNIGDFTHWGYTFKTLAGLFAGTEHLANETQLSGVGELRHGSFCYLKSGVFAPNEIEVNDVPNTNTVFSGTIASGQIGNNHFVSGATINKSLYSAPFVSGTISTALTEETISGVRAVTISQSGNLRIAMASVSGRNNAIGVVFDNVLSGIQANVYTLGNFQFTSGLTDYSGYLGQTLYVGRSGQITTTSGSFNSGGLLSGDVLQLAGYATNSGGLTLQLHSPYVSGSTLGSGIVISGSIASGQVGTNHIASGSVRSGNIASGQIGHFHISSGAITSGQLGTTGTPNGTLFLRDDFSWAAAGGGLSSGAVGSGYVASGTVQGFFGITRHIASGTVGSFDFGSGAILSGAIASGQIGQFHISSGAITSGKLGTTGTPNGTLFLRDDFSWAAAGGGLSSGAVGSGYVASGTVQGFFGTTRNIASGTVGVFDFGSGAILSGAIASGQIGTNHLANNSVLSGVIGSGQISTFHIASGGLLSGAIGSGQIGVNHLASGAVLSGAIASGQIGNNHLANNAVRSGAIGSGQISTFHIASGGLLSGAIGSGQIGNFHIASGAIGSGDVVSGTIQGFFGVTRHIASGTVGSFDFGSGAILSGAIASGQIGINHLASGSVRSGVIASGQISTNHFASGTTATRSIYVGPFASGTISSILTEETISGVRAVTVSQSGNLRVAMASVSGRFPAIGVVFDNVLSGIQANVYTLGNFQFTSGLADYSGYLGQSLYLGRSGQIVTTSGSFNSGGFASTDSIQYLGTPINSGGVLLELDPPVAYQGFSTTAVKTTTYNANVGELIPCDSTGGGFTVTLPTAPLNNSLIYVKHVIQASTNAITINAGGSDVFNKAGGSTSLTLALVNQGVWLQYNSSTAIWYVLVDDLPLATLDTRYDQTFTVTADGNLGATPTINWSVKQRHTGTITANISSQTWTAPIGPCEIWATWVDTAGGHTIVWPGSVIWEGAAPDLLAAGETLLFSGIYDGTNYRLTYFSLAATYFTISQTSAPSVVSTSTGKLWVRNTAGALALKMTGKDATPTQSTLTMLSREPVTGSTTSSATPTINTDLYDLYRITALAADITSMTTNLSGTPVHGQALRIEITGTATRAITWGASFEDGPGYLLPTTTLSTTELIVDLKYNAATSKWQCQFSSSTVVNATNTITIINKRMTKRAPSVTQSATPAINTDVTDVAHITGLAQAITSMTTSLTGTPVEGDQLRIDITDNGTARAITWGASFESSGTVTLPTTTVISTRLDVCFVWNTATSKWRCVGVS